MGTLAGAAVAYVIGHVAASQVETLRLPRVWSLLAAAAVLIGAAVLASLMPAARAARVDVVQAMRSE